MAEAESSLPTSAAALDQVLRQAIAHHQAGQLQDAERLYRAILQVRPDHPDANHNLGVLGVQVGQVSAALPHFKAALEANPDHGQYWLSYIDALIQAGQDTDARQVLEQGRQRGLRGEAVEALAHRLEARSAERSNAGGAQGSGESPVSPQNKKAKSKAAKGKGPATREADSLVALFNKGRYAEVATFAQEMTKRYPLHHFGWKMLGAAFGQMGLTSEALAPLQKAAALLPSDALAHNNLGAAYRSLGRFDEAEASFRHALRINPGLAAAHYNLGNTLNNLGRMNEAEASYRRALQIKPDYAEAHGNLGNTLQQMGRLDEAEASYRRALQIRPDYAEVYSNLGNSLQESGRLDEAEATCRQAINANPGFADAHNNLGAILHGLGRLEEAVANYRRALEIKPGLAEARLNVGHILYDLGDVNRAVDTYKETLGGDPENIGLEAAVNLAVLHYLDGNHVQCQNMLLASQPILTKIDRRYKSPRIYRLYLSQLLSWHQQSGRETDKATRTGKLYVIGESHTLSAHGMTVRHNDQELLCNAQWIAGCKQWHLGNDKPNQYKRSFEAIMARLPRQSIILTLIGEIDCRHDEGIIKAWRKSPDKKLEEVVRATTSGYISYVCSIAKQYGHQVIVGGVPATNVQTNTLAAETIGQLVSCIRTFNESLKNAALVAGMDFLDVYALTDRGDGIADGKWHIDFNHLLPSAMAEAFNRYCVRSSVNNVESSQQAVALTADQVLRQAIVHHQAGQLQDAERLYRTILQMQPGHPDANHNLGVLAVQVSRPNEALPYFKAALETNPGQGQYWLSYIDALLLTGQYDAAREILMQGRAHGLRGEPVDIIEERIDSSSHPDIHAAEHVLHATSKGGKPSSDDIELLVRLLGQDRYEELNTAALRLIEQFPEDSTGWKVLGTVQRKKGQYGQSFESMKKAVEVSPHDAEAHYNLGILYDELGNEIEAESSYRRAIVVNPSLAVAHNNLGVNLHKQGRFEEAEVCLRRALQQNPASADTHNNLSAALHQLGELEEAEASCKKALDIQDNLADAHLNLGNIFKEMGRVSDAESSYRRAIQINPGNAGAYNNLGNLLMDAGRLGEAEACYCEAIRNAPEFADAYNNLGMLLCYGANIEQEIAAYQKASAIDPANVGLIALVFLAVRSYLAGENQQCQDLILASKPIQAMEGAKHKIARAYWGYLEQLLLWHKETSTATHRPQESSPIYIIGDSHSLSCCGAIIRYHGHEMHSSVQWIPGCKQWHLGNGRYNKYKHKFELLMSRIPHGSTILVAIGEIDCRANEGILKAWEKNPAESIDIMVNNTIVAYVNYVMKKSSLYGHRIIIGGVPAAHFQVARQFEERSEKLIELIRVFNATLKEKALAAGAEFLDVYALTDRGDGLASGLHHLDSFHLKPHVYENAFLMLD